MIVIMRRLILFMLMVGAFMVPLALAQQPSQQVKAPKKKPRMTVEAIEWAVFDFVNIERKKEGLSELRWNKDLAEIARVHSQKMSKIGAVSHYEDDLTLAERMRKAGFTSWTALGENVAQNRGYDNPAKAAVEKWMQSDGHRRQILDPKFNVTAVGVAYDGKGQVFLTQEFAKMR